MKSTIALCLCLLALSASARMADPPLLAQEPALSATQIVFVFAGDLWTVPREGGDARRLTTGVGVESSPSFSPDGASIAFTGQYDGNTDVFVVPANGGVPKRLTWHPDPDVALGWTRDGRKVLFTSSRHSYSRVRELFLASLDGGLEEKLPLPIGHEGSLSPDGQRIAYVSVPRAFSAWKRYRGGQTTPIWLATLSTSRIEKVPRENSNDFSPMWVDDRVFFLSDRGGTVTLYSYDTRSKRVTQAVANNGMDFKAASAGPGAIVIEQFGQIHLYDLKTGTLAPVKITLAGDLPELRPKFVNVARRLANAHISPTGARALFEARGEILTVPAEKGDPRNLTGTTGVVERDPAWSPDGKWIAYFSDEAGEYELHVRDSLGLEPARKIRLEDRPTFYMMPRWSPDSRKIAYLDAHLQTWYVDVDQKKPVRVDKDRFWGSPADRAPVWSPDSNWLAYGKRLENYLGAIFVYSLADAKAMQLTDGLSDARYPVFDKEGKYLYFTASTDSGPSLEADIRSASRTVSRSIYLVVLSKNESSPFSPESDEEKAADPSRPATAKPEMPRPEGQAAELPRTDQAKPTDARAADVRIDWDRISQRILAMPLPARRYVQLQAGRAGTLFALEAPAAPPVPGPPPPGGPPGLTVHRYDLRQRRADVVTSGVRFFEISANGEKTLTARAERWSIQTLRPMPPASGGSGGAVGGGDATPPPPAGPAVASGAGAPGALSTDTIEVRSDPRAEWRQMYHDAWRIQREFFYDADLHGLDLAAAIKKYEPYLESVMSRRDLGYVFSDMMGEITVGHLSVFGGDVPDTRTVTTGLLGCD